MLQLEQPIEERKGMQTFKYKLEMLSGQVEAGEMAVLAKMLVWAREREKHQHGVYGTGPERSALIFAAFLHNAFCLIDSHIGSRTLSALHEEYYGLNGFRFAVDAHSGPAGRRPRMRRECREHVRTYYSELTDVLFREPLRGKVLAVLNTRYRNRLTYDPLRYS